MPDPTEKIATTCECGVHFLVSPAARGRIVLCPECGASNRVPKEATDDTVESTPPPVAQSVKAIGAGRLCPNCTDTLADGENSCRRCGYDLVTGRITKPTRPAIPSDASNEPAAAPPGSKVLVQSEVGGFLVGTLLSAVGGAIGSGAWYAIVLTTETESGYMALLLGALCGVGMRLGTRGEDWLGAVIASGIAILAIVGAKYLVYQHVLMYITAQSSGFRTIDFADIFQRADVVWFGIATFVAWRTSLARPESSTGDDRDRFDWQNE
ncbi:MAG: hypothetical protein H6818_23310 [Phycisphaerales bacterium]|nr:hypothetical protein [Phycisphaerales bacterium]